MTLERATVSFFGSLTVGVGSLAAYLMTEQLGWKTVSAVAGCSAVLCGGYIMGRLDS
jgi:hypothetical protein